MEKVKKCCLISKYYFSNDDSKYHAFTLAVYMDLPEARKTVWSNRPAEFGQLF